MDEEPLETILLPDVGGLRIFVGRGMSLWVGQQIAEGDLEAAREGILTQFACARHIARTPFAVNRLIAIAISDTALDKLELLVQQPSSANLYWARSRLPGSLGDDLAVLQWELATLNRSLPSLAARLPDRGDDAWQQVVAEFSNYMLTWADVKPMSRPEGLALQVRLLEVAREELPDLLSVARDDIEEMGDEEIVMRWVLAITRRVNLQIECAFSLSPPDALVRLRELEREIAEIGNRIDAPATPFITEPLQLYLGLHRFDRRVRFLQTVEAIRNHAAAHAGELPATLDELELPAPNDPLTAQPFNYDRDGMTAMLQMASIEGVAIPEQRLRTYKIRLAAGRRD